MTNPPFDRANQTYTDTQERIPTRTTSVPVQNDTLMTQQMVRDYVVQFLDSIEQFTDKRD